MSFYERLKITDMQKEHITILSSYQSTKVQDEKDIEDFLEKANKDEVALLSRREASELIQILLKRPVEYRFPCGKKAILPKKEVNCYHVLGFLEGCLHSCPDGTDVNSCTYLEEHGDELEEAET